MDRLAFVLGHILHRFQDFDFSMDTFDDRLLLQKFIYLLQAHGIYLGYDYSWYLRGPYCSTLATAGFMLDGFYDMMPDGKQDKTEGFANNVVRKRFEKFTKFIKGKERNVNFLEAAASLHFLLNTGMASNHTEAVDTVITKMERGYEYSNTPQEDRVGREYVENVLGYMVGQGLMGSDWAARRDVVPVEQVRLGVGNPQKPVDLAGLPRGMDQRHVDKAFYCMLKDAMCVGEDNVELVGQNVFRPDEERPVADNYIMNDDAVFGIRRKCGIGIPTR